MKKIIITDINAPARNNVCELTIKGTIDVQNSETTGSSEEFELKLEKWMLHGLKQMLDKFND